MKQVTEQFTGTVVAFLCFSLLWGIFFYGDISVVKKLGSVETLLESNRNEEMGVAFNTYKSIETPEILVTDKYLLVENQCFDPKTLFQGIDHDGKPVMVSLEGIWNLQGEEIFPEEAEDGGLCLKESGIYWVYLKAQDSQGYEKGIFMKVFVNER